MSTSGNRNDITARHAEFRVDMDVRGESDPDRRRARQMDTHPANTTRRPRHHIQNGREPRRPRPCTE